MRRFAEAALMAAAACGGPILRPRPPASRVAFLQLYLPAASGRWLDKSYDSDGDPWFTCHPTATPDWKTEPIGVDRGEVFHAFLEGLERGADVRLDEPAETPPEAGLPGLPLGPTEVPDLCRVFTFGSDAADMGFTDLFGPTSLLDLSPGPPPPAPAALAALARRLQVDALLRVILVPWQWAYADDRSTDPDVAKVEIFAEVAGYDRSGHRFLWDLFRSPPRDIRAPDDPGAAGELRDLLLEFAERLGDRVAAEGFDAR
ncbi:MAG: hypothetical protein ACYDCL_06565 [Myxococcales bacterium]